MNAMIWLLGLNRRGSRGHAGLPLSALLLGSCLFACSPDDGKDNSHAAGGTGADSTGGASGTGGGGSSGGGSSGGGTGGSGAIVDGPNFTLGQPETLAAGQPVPVRLVLMGDNVYFANRGLNDEATGAIMSVPKNGGSVSAVASELPFVAGLTCNGTDVLFYSTFGLTDASPREGSLVTQSPGAVPQVASPVQYPYELWCSDDALYFFSSANLIRAPFGAGSSTLVSDLNGPHRRWHEGGRIYITEGGSTDPTTGRLRVWSESHPDTPALVDPLARPEGIVMANGRLYVTCPGDGTVVSIDPTSGDKETVASGYTTPWGIAADSANVYFADRSVLDEDCVAGENRGVIVRLPLDGGQAQTIASGLPCPSTLAVDATGIYWVDNGSTAEAADGSVMKIAKIR
ncbi:MAG: hypothetical protein JW940_03145 [Polyangiaceae bacterium]|nr:hypothetical protein [Polyangiaceae bacterium]